MADAAAPAKRPKGWKLLKAALATRKAATMLAFGFSSGLPFALLIGTLNAWLGDAKINLATSSCGRRLSTGCTCRCFRSLAGAKAGYCFARQG